MPRPARYGMKYSTIRYWQNQAHMLSYYNGIYLGKHVIGPQAADTPDNKLRDLAHLVIAFAFVSSPDHVRQLLSGTYR